MSTRDHRRKPNDSSDKPVDVVHNGPRSWKERRVHAKRRKQSTQKQKNIYLGEYRDEIVEKKKQWDTIKTRQQERIQDGDDDSRERAELLEIQETIEELRSNMDAELSDHPLFAMEMNDDISADEQLANFQQQKLEEFQVDTGEQKLEQQKRLEKERSKIAQEKEKNLKRAVQSLPAGLKILPGPKTETIGEFESEAQAARPGRSAGYMQYYDDGGDLVVQRVVGTRDNKYLLDITRQESGDLLAITLAAVDKDASVSAGPPGASPPKYTPTGSDIKDVSSIVVSLVKSKYPQLINGWENDVSFSRALNRTLTKMAEDPEIERTWQFSYNDTARQLYVTDPSNPSSKIVVEA